MDRCIDEQELKKMYMRCSRDKEWLEPRKLFNLIQFLMFLSDFARKDITSEDTLQLLFIRHQSDRKALDESVEAIFGYVPSYPSHPSVPAKAKTRTATKSTSTTPNTSHASTKWLLTITS
jgi:hypothetical protein